MKSPTYEKLALHGGEPAVKSRIPAMFPGGMKIDQEEELAVIDVLRKKRLFRYYGPNQGPSRVQELEEAFSKKMGVPYSVAVTSGSAALMCGLAALGIGPGDEVIIPAYTWIATAETVMAVGAVPVLAEIDESLMIDPEDIERKITSKTKAVIPVHMRGRPCDMDRIMSIARKHHIKVLEDTAQADGASYRGKRLGSIGDVGAFSFQFNKIITSGEGGIAITTQKDLFERMLMYHDVVGGLRNQIPPERILPGLNFRMSEIQGAIMLVQLLRLDGLLSDMRYRKAMLKDATRQKTMEKGVKYPILNDPEGEAAISLIFILPEVEKTLICIKALQAEGVPAGILYQPDKVDYHIYPHWAPVMNQKTWSEKGGPWRWHDKGIEYKWDMCPRTLDILSRTIHLDISPDLSNENIEELSEGINKVFDQLL